MILPEAEKKEVDLLIVAAVTGNLDHLHCLLSTYEYKAIHLIKAYKHALGRKLKLEPNEEARYHLDIKVIRETRTQNLLKHPTSILDKTLLEQGRDVALCVNQLWFLLSPHMIIDEIATRIAFVLAKTNNYLLWYDFLQTYNIYIDLNYQNSKGWNQLHVATHLGNTEMVKYLLKHPIDIDTPTYKSKNQRIANQTALHLALSEKHINIVKLLLKSYASVHVVDATGRHPLHYVAPGQFGHDELFELLLQYRADINCKFHDKTMLYELVQHNWYQGIEYLLRHGASYYATSLVKKLDEKYPFMEIYELPIDYIQRRSFSNEEQQNEQIRIITLLLKYK